MLQHLRASLWLLCLTLFLCCVVYPLTLWIIGQTVFRHQADGSLIAGADKKPVGSRLIAQAFTSDEYFQPRPSNTGGSPPYNALASGASNYGASNPKLRGRVAQQLGTIVRYRPDSSGNGELVGKDVEAWFQTMNDPAKGDNRRDLTAEWAERNPSLIAGWATSAKLVGDYVNTWAKDHAGVVQAWRISQWKAQNPEKKGEPTSGDLEPFKLDDETKAADLAPFLFDPTIDDSFVKLHPGKWPCTVEKDKDGKKVKSVEPATEGDDVRSIFFDMWLQEHGDLADTLEPVPADLVMSSGSGLDPHITLKNALYQLPRVADKWAELKKRPPAKVRQEIEDLLRDKAAAPLGGWAGVPLINVLEINLALSERRK